MSQIYFRDEATGDWFAAPNTPEVRELVESFTLVHQTTPPAGQHVYLDFEDDFDASEIRDYFEMGTSSPEDK